MNSKFFISLLSLLLLQTATATLNVNFQNALLSNTRDFKLRDLASNRNATSRAVARTRQKINSCPVSICFAIDGSASITPQDFNFQREFVALISSILGAYSGAKIAVVEYGGIVSPVVELGRITQQAIRNISTDTSGQSILTFVGPSIGWCDTQFKANPMPQQRIVVIGDGQSTLGDVGIFGSTAFGAVSLSEKFVEESPGNRVLAVVVSNSTVPGNREFFLEVVQGRLGRLFGTRFWRRLPDILENLISGICTFNGNMPNAS